jgi:hypothetical protein
MNGMGTLLHHTSAAWLIVCCTTGLFQPRTRETLAVTLPLVGQHLGVLMKYHSIPVYALVNLCLEIWWEWELIGQQKMFKREWGYHASSHGCSLTMLFAHWLYWGAAIIGVPEMLSPAKEKEEEEGDAESPPDLSAVQVALHKPGTHDVEQSPSGAVGEDGSSAPNRSPSGSFGKRSLKSHGTLANWANVQTSTASPTRRASGCRESRGSSRRFSASGVPASPASPT